MSPEETVEKVESVEEVMDLGKVSEETKGIGKLVESATNPREGEE